MGNRIRARRQILQGGLALAGLGLAAGCGLVSLPDRWPAGPRRIGLLNAGNNPTASFETFHEGLGDLGYVEGQNLLIEYRDAEGHLERLPALAAELVRLQVEIIVARDSTAARPASQATSTIPIVVAGGNVVSGGLVTNIARPEGNVTGVTTNHLETLGKWVELLKETVPTISHLAVVSDASSVAQASVEAVQHAAETLKLPPRWSGVRDLDQLPAVLATARAEGADSVMVLSGGVISNGSDPRIGHAVLMARLPAVAEGRDFAANGGLMAHGIKPGVLPRRAATYVDKILKGAKPGDLPIELPTEFNVVVNLKAGEALGVTVPQSVLARATELIQ